MSIFFGLFPLLSLFPLSFSNPMITLSLVLLVFIRTALFTVCYELMNDHLPIEMANHSIVLLHLPIPIFSMFPPTLPSIIFTFILAYSLYLYWQSINSNNNSNNDNSNNDSDDISLSFSLSLLLTLIINDISYFSLSFY